MLMCTSLHVHVTWN